MRTMDEIMRVIDRQEFFRVIFTFGVEMIVIIDEDELIINVTPHVSKEDQGWYDDNYTTTSFKIWPSGQIDLELDTKEGHLSQKNVSTDDIRRIILPVPYFEMWQPKDDKERREADMLASYISLLSLMWFDWN